MKSIASLLSAALCALALVASPATAADKPGRPTNKHDCSAAKDPVKCQARRDAFKAASTACKGRPRAERGACMSEQMCARAADPAQCRAKAAERRAQRSAAREACKGMKGKAYKDCRRAHKPKRAAGN